MKESRSDYYRGMNVLHDPIRNKGTAFTEVERDALGLRGLLPPHVSTMDTQVMRVMDNLRRKSTDLERYIYLISLQDRNETLFYRVLVDYMNEMMPLVYTPTVGKACQLYGHLFRRPRGLFLSIRDRGKLKEILRNWPHVDTRIIVVTDGERILGLGDLGANGMGIPVGKLTLYTACAGIPPTQCLPITLDVGTNNRELLKDPLYIGTGQERVRGSEYDAFFEEFVEAVKSVFPDAIIQLEDFANSNAFRLLEQYRERVCLFDDDIQGTASVVLAGLLAGQRLCGKKLGEQRLLFFGAGEAGIGIGSLVTSALQAEGLSKEEARMRCWFFDTRGLVVKGREHLASYKLPFAHQHEPISDFLEAIDTLKPTGIIGVSGVPQSFDRSMLEAMAALNERPLVFALSNPTSKSECTAKQAYKWTEGRAIFASGSPFDPVDFDGKTYVPGQGNNAYIFPGVGLGAIFSKTRTISDEMFLAAAEALAGTVSEHDLELGRLYPSLSDIREVSAKIAVAVAEVAYRQNLAMAPPDVDMEDRILANMYVPDYPEWKVEE